MADWVIVVDDDQLNLQMAGKILSKAGMRVTALKSGALMLDYVAKNGCPDLLLLDIKMPDLNGFETLKLYREWEKNSGYDEVPVVFLTADDDSEKENQSFAAGASDYIRKPFVPDILIKRVEAIISKQKKIRSLSEQAQTDSLTGFLNKAAVSVTFPRICRTKTGCLMMLDIDSFKLVNDLYGHAAGDDILTALSNVLKENVPEGTYIGRIGGDEFTIFSEKILDEDEASELINRVNCKFLSQARKILGENMELPLGISAGGVFVPKQGQFYDDVKELADRALYHTKKNGKKGFNLYSDEIIQKSKSDHDLESISVVLGERNIPNSAYSLDKDVFSYVYQFVMRYISRNQKSACKVLFTINNNGLDDYDFKNSCDLFEDHLQSCMRKSDILMRYYYNQYFVFLTDIHEAAIPKVVGSIVKKWEDEHGPGALVTYETEFVGSSTERTGSSHTARIAVVDDDMTNLKIAHRILTNAGYIVDTMESGNELLNYIDNILPDLILLDVNMPGMNGFDTLKKLRTYGRGAGEVPIIYLTGDESIETENEGLSLGAMDFVKKPFVPEILVQRVRHIVDLTTLQKTLSIEIEKKTQENNELFTHVIKALVETIDAKDKYTNGHSARVAKYSKEIAKRYGYNEKAQNDIYMMGLLHDVGKIGIPDAVINKPAKLTDEEFEIVKTHPEKGAKILEAIKEMPGLVIGARWHHERYEGGGYPDGLKGEEIPEEARIIAVADAYDAMSSFRSYRDVLSQEKVRSEIINGRGTQFDPKFADIMLQMISEDSDYNLREE